MANSTPQNGKLSYLKSAPTASVGALLLSILSNSSLAFGTFQQPVSHVLTGCFCLVATLMAKKWRVKLAKSITSSSVKHPFKDPFLSKPDDNDLAKQWVVEYSIWSERMGTLKRKRVVLVGQTVAERLSQSRDVIAEIRKLLRAGGIVDPIAKEPTRPDQPDRVTAGTTIIKAIDVYLAYKEKTTKYNSFRTYRSSLKVLKQYLKDTPGLKGVTLQSFHTADAIDFLDQTILKYGLSNRGHNNTKDNARMFFAHWCNRLNRPNAPVMLTNPFIDDSIVDKSTQSNKHIAYSDAQRVAFKGLCEKEGELQLLLFVQFMYYSFLRPRQELRLLRVRDLKEQTIHINATDAKDNTAEFIEIPSALQALIEENKLRTYPPSYYIFSHSGQPGPECVGPDYFYQHHRKLLTKLAYTEIAHDMYSWKHTGVIALWNATQNIRLIQQQCRHSTAAQTEDYLRDLGLIIRHTQIHDFPEF